MNIHLVVVRPFGEFVRGDVIAEEARIVELLNTEHVHDVVRVVNPSKES